MRSLKRGVILPLGGQMPSLAFVAEIGPERLPVLGVRRPTDGEYLPGFCFGVVAFGAHGQGFFGSSFTHR